MFGFTPQAFTPTGLEQQAQGGLAALGQTAQQQAPEANQPPQTPQMAAPAALQGLAALGQQAAAQHAPAGAGGQPVIMPGQEQKQEDPSTGQKVAGGISNTLGGVLGGASAGPAGMVAGGLAGLGKTIADLFK